MRGFTDRAIVVLPKIENYEFKDSEYKSRLKTSVSRIVRFMNKIGIVCYFITTNEVAVLLDCKDANWINAVASEDAYFLSKNYSGFNSISKGVDADEELLEKARKLYPVKRGLEAVDRFDIIIKREKFIGEALISNFKLVIDFQTSSSRAYKVKSEMYDERLVIDVDNTLFTITTKMSGNPIDSVLVMGDKKVTLPLYEWE